MQCIIYNLIDYDYEHEYAMYFLITYEYAHEGMNLSFLIGHAIST